MLVIICLCSSKQSTGSHNIAAFSRQGPRFHDKVVKPLAEISVNALELQRSLCYFLDYLYLHIIVISTVTHFFDCLKMVRVHHRHLSNSFSFTLLLKSVGGKVSIHCIEIKK